MKRGWIIVLIVVVTLGLFIYLLERGFLKDLSWEEMTMTLAAVFGPAKMLFLWTKTDDDEDKAHLEKENKKLKKQLEDTVRANRTMRVSKK